MTPEELRKVASATRPKNRWSAAGAYKVRLDENRVSVERAGERLHQFTYPTLTTATKSYLTTVQLLTVGTPSAVALVAAELNEEVL